jgi:hypothetical protein
MEAGFWLGAAEPNGSAWSERQRMRLSDAWVITRGVSM